MVLAGLCLRTDGAVPQGFASGNPDTDAYCVRKMVELGVRPLVCQSFAKNMGLYGERVGCFSIVCADAEEAERVTSQVKQRVLRALWSFPPVCPLPNGLLSHLSTTLMLRLTSVGLRAHRRREGGCADSLRAGAESAVVRGPSGDGGADLRDAKAALRGADRVSRHARP